MSSPFSFLSPGDTAARIERLFGDDPPLSRSKPKYGSSHKAPDQDESIYAKNKEKTSTSKRHIPDYDYTNILRESRVPYDPAGDTPGSREQLLHYRRAAESAHSEQAALLVKNTSLQNEVSDLKDLLAAKEALLRDTREELDKSRESAARQTARVQLLKSHVRGVEQMSASGGSKAEINAEIYALNRANKELNERVKELDSRLRVHLLEREKLEQRASTLERRLQEVIRGLASCLKVNAEEQEDAANVLLTKVNQMVNEYFLQKSHLASLEDALVGQQAELKASRDTIMKLVSEAEKQKKAAAGSSAEHTALRMERDEAVSARRSLEREKEMLLDQLKDNHKEWGSCQQELLDKEQKLSEMDRSRRTSDYQAKASHSLHQTFINQLATMLSNGFLTVPRTEDAVKERVQEIRGSEQRWKETNEDLQERVAKLTKQLEQQRDLYHEAASKSYKAEEALREHQESLKHLKGQLSSEEMIKDGFTMERKKLKKFLVQLAEKLNMNRDISLDGLTSQYEALLSRAEELSKMDKEYLSDNKSLIYNLQKKLNSQREKIELKSSQIEQLEKKMKLFEREKDQVYPSAENSQSLTVQKLQKKVEKLQGQLSDMKITNQNLTAQLDNVNDLKEKIGLQKKTIEELSRTLEKLDKIKEKAAKKVVSLKSELDLAEQECRGDKVRSQHMVDSIANELHTAKRALEEVARREKQLVDFRESITRMMGFSVNTLAVPDHEIFDQLKRVLRSHGPVNTGRADRSKLPYGFRTGDGEAEYTARHVNSF